MWIDVLASDKHSSAVQSYADTVWLTMAQSLRLVRNLYQGVTGS